MDSDHDRAARVFAWIITYTFLACVAAIVIGLAINIPWLGIPVAILAVIAYFMLW
jgi:uncharacterized membrane protein (DUF485 family)